MSTNKTKFAGVGSGDGYQTETTMGASQKVEIEREHFLLDFYSSSTRCLLDFYSMSTLQLRESTFYSKSTRFLLYKIRFLLDFYSTRSVLLDFYSTIEREHFLLDVYSISTLQSRESTILQQHTHPRYPRWIPHVSFKSGGTGGFFRPSRSIGSPGRSESHLYHVTGFTLLFVPWISRLPRVSIRSRDICRVLKRHTFWDIWAWKTRIWGPCGL